VSKLNKELKGVAKELGGGSHGTGKKKSTTKGKKGKKGGASLEKQAKKLLK
jgi:hypothetical protein